MESLFFRFISALTFFTLLSACSSGIATSPADTTATVNVSGKATQNTAPTATTPAAPSTATMIQETVHYKSFDGLDLVAYVYRPNGTGPYPSIVYNHGSEQNPDPEHIAVMGQQFVDAGYVLIAPIRRGQGPSAGEYITDTVDAFKAQNPAPSKADVKNYFMDQMEGPQVKDQLAGLNYLKNQSYADKNQLAVIGCSYGGMETLIGAGQPDTGYKAAISISPGAESWGGPDNETFHQRLIDTTNNINIPIFIIHPAKDVSLEPGFHLAQALLQ